MWFDYACQITYSSVATLRFTNEAALICDTLKGDFVECGVAAGAQVIAMLAGTEKVVHAFDSFQGIPLPSNRDYEMPGIKMLSESERVLLPNPGKQVLVSSGVTSVPEKDFLNHILKAFEPLDKTYRVVIHSGWFEETMKDNQVDKIALLRLDGDLYHSTIICLEYLYPKVVQGGHVIIDDWHLRGCQEACMDYFGNDFSFALRKPISTEPNAPIYFVK